MAATNALIRSVASGTMSWWTSEITPNRVTGAPAARSGRWMTVVAAAARNPRTTARRPMRGWFVAMSVGAGGCQQSRNLDAAERSVVLRTRDVRHGLLLDGGAAIIAGVLDKSAPVYFRTIDTPPFTVRILSGTPPRPRSAERFLPTVPWTVTGKSHLTPPLVVPASRWRRVAVRHRQANAAVVGLNVEALADPAVAGQVDLHAAVGRAAAHVAVDVGQRDAAVGGFHVDFAMDALHGDAAVLRPQRQAVLRRRHHLEAHAPSAVADPRVGLRCGSVHRRSARARPPRSRRPPAASRRWPSPGRGPGCRRDPIHAR